MHIDPADFIEPMLHTGGGLGETGEVMLVDQDVTILTSLRHTLANGNSPEPLKFKIKTGPAQFAARGEEGITESEDYRGKQVLAAYRHLRITSETGWGMVVKRDVSEIFAPFKEALVRSIVITVFGLFLVIALITVITRKITGPVLNLTRIVEQVEKGNLKHKAEDITGDEIGTLALSFNRMIDRMNDTREKDRRNEWLKTGKNELNYTMSGNPDISELADNIVRFLAEYLDAKLGALYLINDTQMLELEGSYAFTGPVDFSGKIAIKEGLAGQAAYTQKRILLTDVPKDYVRISSTAVDAVPKMLIVMPIIYEDESIGVLELASLKEFSEKDLEFLDYVIESIAVALYSAQSRLKMKALLKVSGQNGN